MSILHKTTGVAASVIAVVGIFSTLASAAHAAAPVGTRSVTVSYGHLDLGRAGAVDAVYRQLAVAAARACGAYEPRNLRERNDWRRCREAAVSEAVARFLEARIAGLNGVKGYDLAARL